MNIRITLYAVAACLAAAASADAGELEAAKCQAGAVAAIDADYLRPVRPIGVAGQPEWNVRSVFFMYPPTFGFARRDEAASYRFTVKDEAGGERTFIGRSPSDSLAPVWGDLPLSGWMDVRCEAMDAQGRVVAKVGERSFWKQAPFLQGTYPAAKRSAEETAKLIARYQNLTKHDACDTAMYLVSRFPSDPRRLAQARELVRFAEDQFVCWERPMHGKKDPRCKMGVWGCESWRCPAVLEQYNCYVPIDSSAAKMIRTYLAMFRATKKPLDLARARALGDAIIRETRDDGYLPTFWMDSREDWPNCMLSSAAALTQLCSDNF